MYTEEAKIKRATYHLWTFMTSKLISSFGSNVYAFAISFYILQVTASASIFAINLICSILPRILVGPIAGYVADNFSKKRTIIIAQIVQTLTIGGLLIYTISFGLSLYAIYTTTIVLSLASSFSTVTFSSSITRLIDEARIQRAMSLNQMSVSIATIGGPVAGGILYGTVSIPVFLAIYMTASAIAVILDATMNFNLFAKPKDPSKPKVRESAIQNFKEGLVYLRKQKLITALMFVALLVNFLFGAVQVGFSYVLINLLHMESQHVGIIEGALAVGFLIGSIYFSIGKEVKYPLLVSKRGIIGMGLGMGAISIPLFITLSYWGNFTINLIIMLSIGMLSIVVNTPVGVVMQKTIDNDYKGRVFSILETTSMALMPLGMVIFGFLYDLLPAEWVLIGTTIILIVIVLYLLRPSVIYNVYPELNKRNQQMSKVETTA